MFSFLIQKRGFVFATQFLVFLIKMENSTKKKIRLRQRCTSKTILQLFPHQIGNSRIVSIFVLLNQKIVYQLKQQGKKPIIMKAELKIKSVVLSLLFWKEKVFLKSHLICFSTMQYSKINKSSLFARTSSLFDNFIDNFFGKVRVCVWLLIVQNISNVFLITGKFLCFNKNAE